MSHCLKMFFSHKKLINSLHKMFTMRIEKYYEISNQWVFVALENIVALNVLVEIVFLISVEQNYQELVKPLNVSANKQFLLYVQENR